MLGIATWLCNYPVDVIKTNLQSSTQHSTMRQAAEHILKTEGPKGFYKGTCLSLIYLRLESTHPYAFGKMN